MSVLNKEGDTICAISSPSGEGAISVIRISGRLSIQIFNKIFKPKSAGISLKPRRFYVADVYDPFLETNIDEAGFVFMQSPNSYTGEDMVEIYPHGGVFNTRHILEIILRLGARLAYNGEYTKRAYLNNKLTLLQAEAVLEIIKATSVQSLVIANNERGGLLEPKVNKLKENFLYILALIEALIDFPEEEFKDVDAQFFSRSEQALDDLNDLIDSYNSYAHNKQGLSVVIAGRPNAGKSSLLNSILQKKRAIVSDIPGTTRDYIEENLFIFNKPIRIIDTAGLRDAQGAIESEGVGLSYSLMDSSDIILYVIDITGKITEDEIEFIKGGFKKTIVVFNKIDALIPQEFERKKSQLGDFLKSWIENITPVYISAVTGTGMDVLKGRIYKLMIELERLVKEDITITTLRQKGLLERAADSLFKASYGYKNKRPLELISIDLRDAVSNLDELMGAVTNENILDTLFKEFCIGK